MMDIVLFINANDLVCIGMYFDCASLESACERGADIITAIQRGIQPLSEISSVVGCVHEPAYRVSREHGMISHIIG